MKLKHIIYLLFLILINSKVNGCKLNPDYNRIDSLINQYYYNCMFNGVVLVSVKGEVIYNKAFGIADREWNVNLTTDTKFKIGSISKPFTSIIILQLVHEKFLSLDLTLAEIIPEFNCKGKDKITIHQLLTHTSGLLNSLEPLKEEVNERLHHSLRELIKYAESAELYFEPGTGFHYSNFGYNILAYIAEKVTGKSFAELLKERIFDPLEMADTKQYSNTKIEERLAKGYEYKLLSGFENAAYYDNSYAAGSGGIVSTANDLYKFHKALFTNRMIPKQLSDKMIVPTKHGKYGYGWGINEIAVESKKDTLKIIDHGGSVNGFGSYMANILNDTVLVIVLKNFREDSYLNPAFASAIGKEVISILYGDDLPIHRKSIAKHLAYIIGHYGIRKAEEEYSRIKENNSENYNLDESELNKLGIELYFKFNMIEESLKIFELNMNEFPKSYNTYDSYAFILMQMKDYISAIEYYKKGLGVLAEYPEENAGEQVKNDAAKALISINEMEMLLRQN